MNRLNDDRSFAHSRGDSLHRARAAEALQTRKVFTLDKADFGAYRIRRGHRHQPVDMIG